MERSSPSSVLCSLLYRTEHFSRGDKGEKVARKGEEEGWPGKGRRKEKGSLKTGQLRIFLPCEVISNKRASNDSWGGSGLSSPHRGIALAMMPASWPTSQWISAARVYIAVQMYRIAKEIFCDAHCKNRLF